MADIFVCHSRLDEERVAPLVERLASLGYTVWRDPHVRTGRAFEDSVEREIAGARAVLVVWSENARNSTWVVAEAAQALDAGKLAQLRIDAVPAPAPFNAAPIADMSGGRSAWGPLEDTLAKLVRNGGPSEAGVEAAPAPIVTGVPRPIAIAIATALGAFGMALSATLNGLMAPAQLQLAMYGVLAVGAVSTALAVYRLWAVTRAGG